MSTETQQTTVDCYGVGSEGRNESHDRIFERWSERNKQ